MVWTWNAPHGGRVNLPVALLGLANRLVHDGDGDESAAPLPGFGVGGDAEKHAWLVTHGLRHVYSRLSPGAVLVVMDYHVPGRTMHGNDSNPGTRIAVDAFLTNKPEKPRLLYGGACSHAYIRKL